MPIFSQLKYNNYIPQYVGAPLDEYLAASTAVQDRYNKVTEGYSLIGELADTLETSPLEGDRNAKMNLLSQVNKSIEEAAGRGDFDTMQNEMRKLAKDYSKQATPIKENLSRFQAAEKAIAESKLPQQHINFLRQNLYSKPGLSYDQNGLPQYLQADTFAENVDLREVYEKFINDYKSDKGPGKNGIRAHTDPQTGLVEYYDLVTNERVDAAEVMDGLQRTALFDPKVRSFIMQDAAANGVQLATGKDFLEYATPLMQAYTDKAAFDKMDLDWKLGEAGGARAKQKEDELPGFTFDINWGVPAKQGVASPSDLRNTRESLTQSRQTIADEYGKFLQNNGDAIDPLTGKSKSGIDYSDEIALYNQQLDGIDAQKFELSKVEADARRDAGLPANYVPNQKVLDKATADAEATATQMRNVFDRAGNRTYNDQQIEQEYRKAYDKSIDNSNDPSIKAYKMALAKNAKDRTDVKGMTSFASKKVTEELERLGNSLVAGEWGGVKAMDVATGRELTDIDEYGTAVKNPMWTVEDGKTVLTYQTGNIDDNKFVPSGKWIKVIAPPELEQQMIDKGYISPVDLDILRQFPSGRVQIGGFRAGIEIKRNAQTTSAPVVVTLNDGKKRIAFPGQGDAVKFLSNLAKLENGNK